MNRHYQCVKCGNSEYEKGEMRVTGGFWSKIFDVQNKKYIAIICTHCGYTEFYKDKGSRAGDIFDFFTN